MDELLQTLIDELQELNRQLDNYHKTADKLLELLEDIRTMLADTLGYKVKDSN